MKNNKGFSLVEILIAIGILCGLSVWMMHLFKEQSKNEKTTAANLDIDAIGNEIRNILGDSLSCEKTFKGMAPTKQNATTDIYKVLSDNTAQKRFSVGEKKNGNTGVVISSLDLKTDEIYYVPAGKSDGETVLTINWNRGKQIQGAQMKTFKIPLAVVLDSSGNISSCHALASTTSLASICNAIGRGVDDLNKKCSPLSVYSKGDISIYSKQYIHCQGGAVSGERVLSSWTSPATGSVRLSWSGSANDNSVAWRIYKNADIVATKTESGASTYSDVRDIEIQKGDVIKHTAILNGGIDSDCVGDGYFSVGVDLLNMI